METLQYDSPDEEIFAYIAGNYTPEYGEDLKSALSLLYGLEVTGVQDTLCEMIYDISADDKDAHPINFSNYIQTELTKTISLHGIDLEEARLCDAVQVLLALMLVQNCEDPVPYLRVLELNTIDNEEKVARIFKDFCSLDETKLHSVISYVSDTLPGLLYTRLLELEQRNLSDVDEDNPVADVVAKFRQFELCFGSVSFAHIVLNSGMRIGLPLRLYIAYLNHDIQTDPKNYALDIFSILLLASDTYDRPVAAFREHSNVIIGDSPEVQRLETELQKINEKFEQYRKDHP